ncbi:MAG: hypothetical protein HN929_01455 [Chloroflexi bacterium]|jgi:hypothetical protein|nr:hypothetical protein [Chloroflexota bacterium]MBT7080129.1 hypothetical protein [Chloroflexota bacterium]MBT7290207.1 hypothetical protein [Chloroflexota bacterium]
MDWTTFVPTLIATFSGVFLSIILSLLVRELINRRREKRQNDATKHILLNEVIDNYATLKSLKDNANDVISGKSYLSTFCDPISDLCNSAYDATFKSGNIYRLGDEIFERAVMDFASGCVGFNGERRYMREMANDRFGLNEPPIEIVKGIVEPRLPVLDKLLLQGHELIRMMDGNFNDPDVSE